MVDTASVGPSAFAVGGRVSAYSALERAIIQAVVYADIFDSALTPAEIRRYLVDVAASLEQVEAALGAGLIPEALSCSQGCIVLPQRESAAELRRQRAQLAERLWPRAIRYGQLIGRLPFVRMVAVTGALAVDNVEPSADIDYMIVTETGRLWVCRALIIAVVRLAAVRGDVICPNYLLAEHALAISERTLYAARELAQMVPVCGHAVYGQLRAANAWADGLLPNAAGAPRDVAEARLGRQWARGLAEWALRGRLGALAERWEMRRKIRKLSRHAGAGAEAAFCADWCKGHFGGHGQRTLAAYQQRLRAVGLANEAL
jgi:hypothetical protein